MANYRSTSAVISTANTNRDGTGTIVDLVTGPASGCRVDSVQVVATGATTIGMVRLFIYDGTNTRLYKEVEVTAVPSPSGTVKAFETTISLEKCFLSSGQKLQVATHNAETFHCVASVTDF